MAESAPRGGLFSSLRGLSATGLELLQVRLELFAVEIQEEKARAIGLAVYGIAAVILLGAGAIFSAAFVTVLLWDNNRLLALGVFSALFLGGGLFCLLAARRLTRTPSGLFSGSLAEISRDRAALSGDDAAKP
ncbi:MAG: phage holin family protein [Gammaproteobacteria bacterium]|nr:phage holin family protein [Gammaproteobacteria bacterium]MBU1416041.1 phage holin family protein [Gammaproteobacteria bacterium]